MAQELENFRKKYPAYGDIDDTTLAGMLAKKYPKAYGDLPEKVVAKSKTQEPYKQNEGHDISKDAAKAGKTLQDVGKVYPAAETAASLITGSYGLPAAGLAGLAALPLGLDKAGMVVEAVKKALIYEPQTQAGKELLETTSYPFKKLGDVAEKVGSAIEKKGSPNLGATVKTAIEGAPALFTVAWMGGRAVLKPTKAGLSKKISKITTEGIEKGARPSVAGKRTFSQGERYSRSATTAVRQIVENKDNLALTGSGGEVVYGALPQNLKQFSQAIEQTKRNVFNEYNQMAKKAGDKGAVVDLVPIADEIQMVAGNKIVNDLNPNVAKYAEKLSERIRERGAYTAAEAQDAIATLNNNLEAFYKNPSYENASVVYIDSLLVNNLRKSLDSIIEGASGQGYQRLKNTYGSLKTIERDVYRRSVVDARKNAKGLLDFTDVFSGFHAA